MKKLPVENLGFVEIGGVGEMIYRAVRFPEYVPDYDDDGEVLKPVFTGLHAPESGTDYSLTGQELLVSLCNLYGKLNNPDSTESISDTVWDWCRNNIHPYDIDSLCEILESEKNAHITYRDIIEKDATFSIKRFIKDLCDLGTVFELYYILDNLKYEGNVNNARNLYYEGRLRDSLSFLERYSKYEDDKEYKDHVLEDYNDLIFKVIDIFPDFRMRLKLDKKTGKVMFGADVQSVFDICWYTFSRIVADVAPPVDEDLDYFESQGSILSCLACGKYFVRCSSRQLYCDTWDCQAERNRRNRRASYARKKAAEVENKE
ncbi:hypothetical protein [Defluviitalea raffinosedens]|uniref:hypothetical protein n=1 Tax=Defluviitalea raffinosedens TaxID=1450156 RepID=UPI00195D3841|nr:hypothetical protein [Defluviitalea raffinosedens]MBM7686786.1 hypothetical protein [Defluviitalea raffinosedens]